MACEEPAPRPPPGDPATSPPAATAAVLTESEGTVETGAGENWSGMSVGQKVAPDAAVRTATGSGATLSLHSGATLDVEGDSEVTFGDVSSKRARVRLERGRVGADLRQATAILEVETAGSSALAQARDGQFAVFNDGRGLVAVAAGAGEVELTSEGGRVVVGEGERATVENDAAPASAAVPPSVFLRVAWPTQRTRRRTVAVSGQAAAGTVVRVNGRPATVGADGAFATAVALENGSNRVEVEATDMLGRTTKRAATVILNRRAPAVKAKNEGLWE
jgi:hypothetical protein